ncbi:DUF2330 domain-containing protein [Deinococcus antarcticus]|uniref:DUF2330 domain-containing protein n=1 Tax=Deinococcus antarcticus TaxID=1298767 RepID=A0ABV8A5X3_9DEIO
MRLTRKTSALLSLALVSQAAAFCGFFVAKADTKLFNRSNQVIIARDGNRSVFTMMNDYQGNVKDFARIVPIPVVPKREDIRIGDPNIVKKLDAYSAPRLVEYFDEDPCLPPRPMPTAVPASAAVEDSGAPRKLRADALGVKIEASYQVGEYDVLILSARQQNGLATFLRGEGYKLPAGAEKMLGDYLRGGMKFFVVRVNLERFDKSGGGFLNPIVMTYQSERFMLPIRLGTLNSPGTEQDLTLYLLSSEGQVETSNYRTAKIPSGQEVPLFVKNDFANFYRDLFKTAHIREGRDVPLMEYAWNTNWCDPCSTEPPTPAELAEAGVFWRQENAGPQVKPALPALKIPDTPGKPVYLTRLHVRYTAKTYPQDLHFKVTKNTDNFQGRYVLRHPYTGAARCEAGRQYRVSLPKRHEQQAQNLARLTGWDIGDIRKRMQKQ